MVARKFWALTGRSVTSPPRVHATDNHAATYAAAGHESRPRIGVVAGA